MKDFKEYILESIEEIQLDEESAPATTGTSGVAMPDAPSFKKSKVFGKTCIEVDSDTYHACVKGKMPFARWTNYVKDDGLRDEMRKLYKTNKRLMIQDSSSGSMAYIK